MNFTPGAARLVLRHEQAKLLRRKTRRLPALEHLVPWERFLYNKLCDVFALPSSALIPALAWLG
jgi:hypothetical protein